MKERIGLLLAVILITLLTVELLYPISGDIEIKKAILTFGNNKQMENISIRKTVKIDNKLFVMFTTKGNLGEAEFSRGLNGKYKLNRTGYGGDFFIQRIRETNRGKYFIVMGINYDSLISHIESTIEEQVNIIQIPKDTYVIVYKKINNDTKVESASSMVFYNSKNENITDIIVNRPIQD